MRSFIYAIFFFLSVQINAQVGIGTTNPDNSSVLELSSSNAGFLMPRVMLGSLADIVTIPSPVEGLMVYNLSASCGIQSGVHIFDGTKWNRIGYSANNLYARLIKDKLGVSGVTYSNINSSNSYAGFSSLFDGVDNTGGGTFHVSKSGSPSGDWGFGIVFSAKYTIQEVIFEGRNDCCTNRINNVIVRLYRCGALVYSSSAITAAVTGKNRVVIPNIYADEMHLVVPSGGSAGTGNTINFSELEIIAKD
ncbi:MAG: hypothetical protein COA88_03915 [Kordia sp.]|nr:MAG: hypothetical protein COA88_03915 [Kordia sp.]